MPIRRDEFEVGATVLVVMRTGSGAAAQEHRRRAKVISYERAACRVEIVGDKASRGMLIPFKRLEPDLDWLEERDAREDERQRKLDEARLASALEGQLAPGAVLVTEEVRDEARRQIAALSAAASPADQKHEREERSQQRIEVDHVPKPTPEPPSPSEMNRDQVQREIDRLEDEQGALIDMLIEVEERADPQPGDKQDLIDMLIPIEDRLKALKKRRRALTVHAGPVRFAAMTAGARR